MAIPVARFERAVSFKGKVNTDQSNLLERTERSKKPFMRVRNLYVIRLDKAVLNESRFRLAASLRRKGYGVWQR